jgi:hypothetical protein
MFDDAKRRELSELLRSLPSKDAERVAQLLSDYIGQLISDTLQKELPKRFEGFQNALGVSDEVGALCFRIASEHTMPPSDVFLKALSLFKRALDAEAKENRIAILDRNDEIVQEIVGFEPKQDVFQPTAR